MTKAQKKYYRVKADPVRYAAYLARKRREDAARREAGRGRPNEVNAAHKRRWRTQRPEYSKLMRRVNFAVHRTVKSGKLVRPTMCSNCGIVGKIEAHHYKGYAKENWLDVQWLCRRCHMGVTYPKALSRRN